MNKKKLYKLQPIQAQITKRNIANFFDILDIILISVHHIFMIQIGIQLIFIECESSRLKYSFDLRRYNLLLWEILSPRDLQQNLERRFLPKCLNTKSILFNCYRNILLYQNIYRSCTVRNITVMHRNFYGYTVNITVIGKKPAASRLP